MTLLCDKSVTNWSFHSSWSCECCWHQTLIDLVQFVIITFPTMKMVMISKFPNSHKEMEIRHLFENGFHVDSAFRSDQHSEAFSEMERIILMWGWGVGLEKATMIITRSLGARWALTFSFVDFFLYIILFSQFCLRIVFKNLFPVVLPSGFFVSCTEEEEELRFQVVGQKKLDVKIML